MPSSKVKNSCLFNENWLQDPTFKGWLRKDLAVANRDALSVQRILTFLTWGCHLTAIIHSDSIVFEKHCVDSLQLCNILGLDLQLIIRINVICYCTRVFDLFLIRT